MPTRLGQNFLQDPKHLQAIVLACDLTDSDVVIEIGAGSGSLTELISAKAKLVKAVELDSKLIPRLKLRLKRFPNTQIFNQDIFDFFKTNPLPTDYKIIGNIPYYLTGKLIRRCLALEPKPKLIVFLLQKEVGNRIVIGSKLNFRRSILSLSVEIYVQAAIIGQVPAGAFSPKPKVDSVILKLTPRLEPLIPQNQQADFFRLIKICFSSPRKTLFNNLKNGFAAYSSQKIVHCLASAGLDNKIRAERVTISQWQKLLVKLF